ncbi:MAG TPA: hypothetical protein ENN03_05495 [bacterium]|nr:hypothetical protein [bacterium]
MVRNKKKNPEPLQIPGGWSESALRVFGLKYLFVLFIVLLLCLVDGAMTIFLVQRGAWEANPVMRYALNVSHEFFIIVKYFLTAGGLLFLLWNGRVRVFRNLLSLEEIAGALVLLYQGLVIYEITIYHFIR